MFEYVDNNLADEFEHLDFTYVYEKGRVIEIVEALEVLELQKEFAFYDLRLSEADKRVLSHVQIREYNNFLMYLSVEDNIETSIKEMTKEILAIGTSNQDIDRVVSLIMRLTSNILSASGYHNAEIILRSEKHAIEALPTKCAYWHIDKSHGEMQHEGYGIGNYPISQALEQQLYIISLIGGSTLYHFANYTERSQFLSLSNETDYVYGITEEACGHEKINQFFNIVSVERAVNGYGSVHITGKQNGAIHAVPFDCLEDRLLILLTPFLPKAI